MLSLFDHSNKFLKKNFKNSVLFHLMSVMANMEYIMPNINIGYCYHNWLMLSLFIHLIKFLKNNFVASILFDVYIDNNTLIVIICLRLSIAYCYILVNVINWLMLSLFIHLIKFLEKNFVASI